MAENETLALPIGHPIWAQSFAKVARSVSDCSDEQARAIAEGIVITLRMAGIAYFAQTPEAIELAAAATHGGSDG
jgi:hypothetical protein